MTTPRATYRLQFNRAFTFDDAARIAPYLAELGISHLYASPWLEARAGSTHGYDIVDYNAFNPELGGEPGFDRLTHALREHGLGHILDFVPNHMGVAQTDNAWWRDVLEWGRASPYAKYFDIRWHDGVSPRNKVLLPFLAKTCEEALEAGELVPHFDVTHGAFELRYHEHRFPLASHTCAPLIRMAIPCSTQAGELEALAKDFEGLRIRAGATVRERRRVHERADTVKMRLVSATPLHAALTQGLAAFSATPPNEPEKLAVLHHLLGQQHWRLAHWRNAADAINYRRFFDISGLAAVRVENREVFTRMHQLVARLLSQGKLDGLRIDHVDGLYDPAQYLRRLRRLGDRAFFLVVEKILARGESLPANWPVQGTTGYDFLDQVTRVLVDACSEASMTRTYRDFTGYDGDFDDALYDAKLQVIRELFRADLRALARELHSIARHEPESAACTQDECEQALQAIAAAFAVYRTYVDGHGTSAQDREQIARAVAQAHRRCKLGARILGFIETVLAADPVTTDNRQHARIRRFAMRFQQFTAPVMAKGFEDTALYRCHRLIALNEVGGDPRQFALSVDEFHGLNRQRGNQWPHALLATATHDGKRGEDARARLVALSEIPDEWARAAQHWAHLNHVHKRDVRGKPMPDRNDEYFLYQALLGAWPPELTDDQWDEPVAGSFVERMQAYMTKALREARQHTSWFDPDAACEQAVSRFVARILSPVHAKNFLHAFLPFQARLARLGVRNSLVQLALKLTCPGVPDIYQGCELWDFNLVDPDNRRPVDFDQRAALLSQVQAVDALDTERRLQRIRAWLTHWQDGAIKLFVLHKLLRLRAQHPRLFADGDYIPLEVDDTSGDTIAFERRCGDARVLVVAKLHTGEPIRSLPMSADVRFTEILTGCPVAKSGALRSVTGLPIAISLSSARSP